MNIALTEGSKDGYASMLELILLGAAAISIAGTVSTFNKRRFAHVPARVRKRQP